MKQSLRKYIEDEIRDYDQTKKDWEEIQNSVIKGSYHGDDSGIRGTDTSAPTESKALKLITNKRLGQLEKTMKAFESVLTRLHEEKFRLVVLKYWTKPQTLTDEGIALELHCSRATFYNWRDGILLALAKELGMVD